MVKELFDHLTNWKFYLFGGLPTGGPLGGLSLNILLAIVSTVIGLFMGVFFGMGMLSRRTYVRYLCITYIEVIRSTPFLMIIFWFYFILPLLGRSLPLFWCAVTSLSIYASVYHAEIVRAGFLAVPRGQMEAALSTGMSRFQAIRFVIIPQAFKMMFPSFVSFFNSHFKNTSTVYIIGIVEFMQAGLIAAQRQPNKILAAYLCMAIGFWVVCYGISSVAQRLEKKIGIHDCESYKPEIYRKDFYVISLPRIVK